MTKRFRTPSHLTTICSHIYDKKWLTLFLIFLTLMMPLSLSSLKKLWFSTTPNTTRRTWTLWTPLRPLTPKPRLPRRELHSKLRLSSTVEVCWRDFCYTTVNAYRHWSGHINHSLFWKNLAPAKENGGRLSEGPLKSALVKTFGSIDNFRQQFNTTTAGIQGSGWGWLVCSTVLD